MVEVKEWVRARNDEIRSRAGITLEKKVIRRVLRLFGSVERTDEEHWPRMV